ncbi:MAG TPA: transketolase [Vicinamibacteria bacterium]|nr:transketolase [Vicinamibacteria bacterium]
MTTAVRIDQLCINTIRTLAIDAVQKADSGHPGLPLGAAPMGYVLWQNHLRHDPGSPRWPDRDRFVLSAGHGSMLLYALLYLTGYDLTLEDLKDFRQWGSRTPGHPESFVTAGVEATTGPLGQGFGNAVGMAMAERALAHRFNRPGHVVVDHHTYALVSDGDLMEGVAAEAASIAGQLELGKIVFLYDANDVTLDGPASWSFSREDVKKRFEAYGWQVLAIDDGDHDIDAIDSAILEARQETSRPSLIIVHTTIGYGSPAKQGKSAAHGAPLGVEEVAATKKVLGWDPGKEFYVPDDVKAHFRLAREKGARWSREWGERFESYQRAYPDLAIEWERRFRGELPSGWDQGIPTFEAGKKMATREASGKVLNAIAESVPELIGGDADLSSSTKTALDNEGSFDGQTGAGRNIHFGVREHAMGAIVNGFAYHGGLRPYASTFFVFSDYMRPAVRLAALSGLPTIYVWTHDSVGVGEDGPTHQPVEHLASLRAMPNLHVIRPADGSETSEAWRYAMERTEGPTALVLTRQKVMEIDRGRRSAASGLWRGGYVLSSPEGGPPQAIVIATGSEVEVALTAEAELEREGVRVRIVSMPCWELFEAESAEYREEVLPSSVRARVSVEAAAGFGWSRFVGPDGIAIGIDRFGASAPGDTNLQKLGITAEAVVRAVKSLL